MIVLAACRQCQKQFFVTDHSPGEKLPCRCGGVIEVPRPREEPARVVRCPSCGASRQDLNAARCAFCGSLFSTVDKGWGLICPHCFCRLPNDAHYCVECGLALAPQELAEPRAERLCPRCQAPLRARRLESVELLECGGCNGLWVPIETFETLCTEKEKMAEAKRFTLAQQMKRLKFELSPDEQVKYIPCPVCRQLMNRRNFAQYAGVIIDVCQDHGVWLDNQELNRIIQFIEGGGLEQARQLQRESEEVQAMREKRARQHRAKRVARGTPYEPGSSALLLGRSERSPRDGLGRAVITALDLLLGGRG